MADSSQAKLYSLEESTLGTTPASAMTEQRFTSESLGYNIANITSNEIRGDRQITDLVQTDAEPSGDINFELSYGSYDDDLKAVLFSSDWSTLVAVSATDISAVNSTNSFDSSSTDFTGENISAGQWIKVAGFTESANNGYFKVVSVAASSLVVSGGTLTDEAAGDTVTMAGSMIRNGTTMTGFTKEKYFSDIGKYLALLGMVPGSLSMNVAAGEIINGTLSYTGMSVSAMSDSSAGTGAANSATTTKPMNAVSNVANIREGGSALSGTYARSLSLNLDNGLRGKKAVGNLGNIGIGSGRCNVTGNIEIYFEDETLYNKYINGTASSLDFRAYDAAGNAYIFTLPNVEYSSGDPLVAGNDQDVVLPMNFQALRDATTNCTIQIDRFAA